MLSPVRIVLSGRVTDKDKASAFVTSIYSQGRSPGVNLTTASAVNAGLRYEFNLNPRVFAFVFTDFDHDRFQQLDVRKRDRRRHWQARD
jgi:hypothetical protein